MYRHIRLDKNEPFYIGIGSDNGYRAKDKKKRNKIWKDIVTKSDYEVEILLSDLTWEEACEKEKEFILLYGRICNGSGCLANLSLGGEGYLDPPPDIRKKLSDSKLGEKNPMFGKKIVGVHKAKILKGLIGRPVSEETRRKIACAQKGIPRNSEEQKAYLSKINTGENHPQFGKSRSKETREKIAKSRTGSKHPAARKIIDTSTGKVYGSVVDCLKDFSIKYSTLTAKLKNRIVNNTPLKYLEDADIQCSRP